jgi:HEAT repeat protein
MIEMIDMKAQRRNTALSLSLVFALWLFGCGYPEVVSSGEGRFARTDISLLPGMISGLKSKDASTRARSAATIGGMGPAAKDAVPALITLLKDREISVRAAGAHALGQMRPVARKARPDLESLAKQAPLRDVATKAIERIKTAE